MSQQGVSATVQSAMTAIPPDGETARWHPCSRCRSLIFATKFARNLHVCPDCGQHMRLGARERIEQLLDPGSAEPVPVPVPADDPLGFTDLRPYPDRLAAARTGTGLDEAALCARGAVEGRPVVVVVMEFGFLGGSMGCAVGERVCAAAEEALATRTPLLIVAASGGARMQEGALALMQMAKTSAALAALDEAGVLTVSLVTDPTYGGVAASYVTLADVILAEPGARMGFAGPRVIEQTIGQRLPEGFQTAEFLLARGLVDRVVPRAELRGLLARLLAAGRPRRPVQAVPRIGWAAPIAGEPPAAWRSHRLAGLPVAPAAPSPLPARRAARTARLLRSPDELPHRDPWEVVRLARHPARPTTLDYAGHLVDGFVELHGDRLGGECPAIVGGVGRLDGEPLMLIGHQKGHTTRELAARDFGMPSPAGYRKAARLMRLAAKLGLPVVTLIDTPGAHPGIDAEEGGQAIAIAESIRLMATLPVPVVAVVTGEGGSGGALALGVADRVLAVSNAVYSVISPEGCASILWRDTAAAPSAAAALRLDAGELLRLGIVDGVVPEPEEGAHTDPAAAAEMVRAVVKDTLEELATAGPSLLVRQRRDRFRRFGAAPVHERRKPGDDKDGRAA